MEEKKNIKNTNFLLTHADVYLRQKNEWVSEEMKNEPHQLPATQVQLDLFRENVSQIIIKWAILRYDE